ncbi:hypothetical protein BKK81_23775 [Cupriavidus sp. USMAHM13]|uniref:SH3 domain-containing protein n=1 Tax=Cupriavidus sp. USMAHM13 TaxID=1389192 RepID=UPI0008A6D1EF|nr:SH3 domain-containing protein [Cupriavidus sp. USMAHM13]AOZ02298.1 hypothetical protein BKK81_23775 [Cupriavidus sp. USMAHM13]
MRKNRLAPAALAGLAGLAAMLAQPGTASAQVLAYTNGPVMIYAGPSAGYPAVAQLAPGTAVTVMGCVSGYSWCDIGVSSLRGWVYGGSLTYPYQGRSVPLLGYGAMIGLPILSFSLGAYWGDYYRGRPWYGDRDRWSRYRPPGGYGPPPHPGPRPPAYVRPPGLPPGHAGPLPGRPPGGHAGGRPPGPGPGGWHGGPGGGHGGPGGPGGWQGGGPHGGGGHGGGGGPGGGGHGGGPGGGGPGGGGPGGGGPGGGGGHGGHGGGGHGGGHDRR